MSDKREFIEAYFRSWEDKLDRAKTLIDLDDYIYEGVLVLLCHIGAFSAMRYPTLKDGEAYKKILIEYSGMEDIFDQIDLLFFYQWPRSKFQDKGNYKLNNYDEIKSALVDIYGKEEELDPSKRFVKQEELIVHVAKANIAGFNMKNFKEKLPLFSLAEIAYRYLRCGAVHNSTLCFIDTNSTGDVEEGYIITKEILYKVLLNIKDNLAIECIRLDEFPHEIDKTI